MSQTLTTIPQAAGKTSLFALVDQRLAYLGQSQRLLANNIANLDTPGYSPRVALPFKEMLAGGGALPMFRTNPGDLAPPHSDTPAATSEAVSARAPDGNAVSLAQQLAAVARVQINQQYAVNIYRSYLGMARTALGPSV